ncbi:MAG: Uma2 family endonuclease [SAR324 cluster bacterium]|nr:Uma2 family endonuclease [SAR324 cluster bacterium]
MAFETRSHLKHEFHEGQLYSMAGAKRNHSTISTNLIGELHTFLKGRSCEVHGPDMKVRIESRREVHFVYPDVSITCSSDDQQHNRDFIHHPVLIAEVLSHSTEAYDRGEKFNLYKRLTSLKDYVLINSHIKRVEIFHKIPEQLNSWMLTTYEAGENFVLASTEFQGSVDQLYDKVIFEEMSRQR